jgi:hypothetical protein
MPDTLTGRSRPLDPRPKYRPLHPPTHHVLVAQTRYHTYRAYLDGELLCAETATPFKAAAVELLARGCPPEDRIVIRIAGANGHQHEGLVKTVGELAQGSP